MKYWLVEIEYPVHCEATLVYFEAKTKEEADGIASEITQDYAIEEAVWRCYDEEMDEDEFIDGTYYKLHEVPYEEAKDYI